MEKSYRIYRSFRYLCRFWRESLLTFNISICSYRDHHLPDFLILQLYHPNWSWVWLFDNPIFAVCFPKVSCKPLQFSLIFLYLSHRSCWNLDVCLSLIRFALRICLARNLWSRVSLFSHIPQFFFASKKVILLVSLYNHPVFLLGLSDYLSFSGSLSYLLYFLNLLDQFQKLIKLVLNQVNQYDLCLKVSD